MDDSQKQTSYTTLGIKGLLGGTLMGLANLVPGISGGTMLLAAGVYPDFIASIADVTRLRFHKKVFVVLGTVGCAAALGILLFAGAVKNLVIDHRWVMYSLFIGLTLGGVPVIKKLAGNRPGKSFWLATILGFFMMAGLAFLQQSQLNASTGDSGGIALMFVAGVAGASAMILPGVSGGYLLLVIGAYIPILSGIDSFKNALKSMDLQALLVPLSEVVLPVGIGVLFGVAVVSNLLKVALERFEQATLGCLLGLLIGAVIGLWPFQQGVKPQLGDTIKGKIMTAETLAELAPKDYPTIFFQPESSQVAIAIVVMILGFLLTWGVAWFGNRVKS